MGGQQISPAIANCKFADSTNFLTLPQMQFADTIFLADLKLLKIRNYIISLLKMVYSSLLNTKNFTEQSCGKMFADFTTKGPNRSQTFCHPMSVFHPLCSMVKHTRICIWWIKKICGFVICSLAHKRNLQICECEVRPRICGFEICEP
jgi:hypothetical protein